MFHTYIDLVYVGLAHFRGGGGGGGFKLLNFNIYLGVQKNENFWGKTILWIFLWGHRKTGSFFLGQFYAF